MIQVGGATLHHGDCLDVLRTLDSDSIEAVVTDPPYGLEFMGREWDAPWQLGGKSKLFGDRERATPGGWGGTRNANCLACGGRRRGAKPCTCDAPQWDEAREATRVRQMRAFQDWCEEWAREVYRVLKPGAHLVAFGGTRTYHRMVCAIEDAGFEVRDQLAWIYGTGFAKVGLLKNRSGIEWCECDDQQAAEHDLRPLRQADLPPPVYYDDERGEVLLPRLPEHSPSELWPTGSEPEASGREQPGLEGRALRRAGQRLRDGAEAGPSEGAEERLRLRTHLGSGADARPLAGTGRGSASSQSGSGRQPAGQPEGLCEPSGALDGRALRDGGCCPRCGKLSPEFGGFSGALKPSHEPICLARKSLSEPSIHLNVLRWGTGALNIDGCRVVMGEEYDPAKVQRQRSARVTWKEGEASGLRSDHEQPTYNAVGRWPANLVHSGDEEVLAAFDLFGERVAGGNIRPSAPSSKTQTVYGEFADRTCWGSYHDRGSAARFFQPCPLTREELRFHYSAKAGKVDRAGSSHPTIKPLSLMRWLVRMVTPPGGTVLDPFAGSGTTGAAAVAEGFQAVLVEREAEYIQDIVRRLGGAEKPAVEPGEVGPLFTSAAA